MTKEEKEAIELIKYIKGHNSLIGFKNTERRDLAETILNLIQKQQIEIEKLNKDNKELDKQAQEYFETIVFKDKVIDLMAEEIASYNRYEALGKLEEKENVKQYFEKKVEEK